MKKSNYFYLIFFFFFALYCSNALAKQDFKILVEASQERLQSAFKRLQLHFTGSKLQIDEDEANLRLLAEFIFRGQPHKLTYSITWVNHPNCVFVEDIDVTGTIQPKFISIVDKSLKLLYKKKM